MASTVRSTALHSDPFRGGSQSGGGSKSENWKIKNAAGADEGGGPAGGAEGGASASLQTAVGDDQDEATQLAREAGRTVVCLGDGLADWMQNVMVVLK